MATQIDTAAIHGADGWLADTARATRVVASSEGDGFITFAAIVTGASLPAADRNLVLRVGTSTIMRLSFPKDMERNERRFGPSRIAVKSLRWNANYRVWLVDEDSGDSAEIAPEHLEGDPFAAVHIADKRDFLVHIQNNHTKYTSPDVLMLGAKSFYYRTDSPELKAACLTIMFHRLIWLEPAELAEADIEFLRWLVAQAATTLTLLQRQLASAPPTKEGVRWTISLATVAGHAALVGNDPAQAKALYAIAGDQAPNLAVSPVSGMNVIHGSLFSGLIEAGMGNMEMAEKQLRAAMSGIRPMVDAHNLFANVWVIGDIADAALSLRQAMIAMVRLNLLSNKNEPMINPDDYFDIHAIKSPVGNFLSAGYCADVWKKLEPITRPAS